MKDPDELRKEVLNALVTDGYSGQSEGVTR